MRHVTNDKGIALVLALLLSLIALAILSALIYFVTQGTEMSGYLKRYRTAGEAAKGAVQLTTREFIPTLIPLSSTLSSLTSEYGGPLSLAFPSGCFQTKLWNPTTSWAGLGCSNDPNSALADATMTLTAPAPAPPFQVSIRIIDSVPGNTDTSAKAAKIARTRWGYGVVETASGGSSGINTAATQPYMYRVEVTSQRATNPDEKANFSVLYGY